ncbi:MAG: hypothetical protein HYR91_04315 [Flavobacteriia bacterium]|nr:hypothetical protein [Flavobacteriia bacterium]
MEIPKDKEVIEGELHYYWFDDDGIFNLLTKKVPRSLDLEIRTFKFMKELTKGKKVYAFVDLTDSELLDAETRAFLVDELSKLFYAVAVSSKSITGEIIPKVYKELYDNDFPLEFFHDEKEAREWLLTCKNKNSSTEKKEIFEGEMATFWFLDLGILFAKSKKVVRTLEMQKRNFNFIQEITKGQKVCLLSDASNSFPPDEETRKYIEVEAPNLFHAMAVISDTTIGEVIPKIFMELNEKTFPINFFQDILEAKEWLKKYVKS